MIGQKLSAPFCVDFEKPREVWSSLPKPEFFEADLRVSLHFSKKESVSHVDTLKKSIALFSVILLLLKIILDNLIS